MIAESIYISPEKEKKPMNCRQQRRSTAVLGVEKSRAAAMAPVSTAGPHAERDPRVFQSCFHRILTLCSATR